MLLQVDGERDGQQAALSVAYNLKPLLLQQHLAPGHGGAVGGGPGLFGYFVQLLVECGTRVGVFGIALQVCHEGLFLLAFHLVNRG